MPFIAFLLCGHACVPLVISPNSSNAVLHSLFVEKQLLPLPLSSEGDDARCGVLNRAASSFRCSADVRPQSGEELAPPPHKVVGGESVRMGSRVAVPLPKAHKQDVKCFILSQTADIITQSCAANHVGEADPKQLRTSVVVLGREGGGNDAGAPKQRPEPVDWVAVIVFGGPRVVGRVVAHKQQSHRPLWMTGRAGNAKVTSAHTKPMHQQVIHKHATCTSPAIAHPRLLPVLLQRRICCWREL